MLRYTIRMGATPWRLAVVVVIAMFIALAWLAGDREAGQSSTGRCLPGADASPSEGTRLAVIALLGDEIDGPIEFEVPHVNRLLRISIPGGEIERERTLGRRLQSRDKQAFFRLNLPGMSLLATAPDGRTVLALIREPAPGRDSVAVIDAASLEVRCRHPLEKGVRYSGLLLGRSGKFYAYGSKPARPSRRWDAVLTIGDARIGTLAGTHTLRAGDRGESRGSGTDWFVYGGALSADERRIVVSYHGHDTTGADQFRIWSGLRVSASGRAEVCVGHHRSCGTPGRTDIEGVHGAVAPVGTGFVGASAEDGLLHLDWDGRVVGRMRVRPASHLMDFALDGDQQLAYVSNCGKRPAIHRLALPRNRQETLASGPLCGQPLTVHSHRFLVLSAPRSSKPGYTAHWPQRLLLIDLEDPASGERVRRSGTPLDAVVVGSQE